MIKLNFYYSTKKEENVKLTLPEVQVYPIEKLKIIRATFLPSGETLDDQANKVDTYDATLWVMGR